MVQVMSLQRRQGSSDIASQAEAAAAEQLLLLLRLRQRQHNTRSLHETPVPEANLWF